MTDLEKLQAALRTATPAPDANAKAETLRLAAENFARLQETADAARPIPEAPQKGSLWKRTTAMFKLSNLRPVLYATSCLVVAGAVFVAYEPLRNGLPDVYDAELSADEAVVAEPAIVMEAEESVAVNRLRLEPKTEQKQTSNAGTKAANAEELSQLGAANDLQATRMEHSAPLGALAPQSDVVSGIAPLSEPTITPQPNTDQFTTTPENPLKITSESPVSTFSIDVDTASYAYVRSSLLNGGTLSPDAIRIEEMINYFSYDYAAPTPTSDVPFATEIRVTQTPWNPDTKLVHIGIQGTKPAVENRPPLNLVFLIDTSGSMQAANKLPLLKQSFALMLTELRPTDQVAIVTYAGSAGTVLAPTPASDTGTILNALDALNAGGSTAGGAGLRLAYALAEKMKDDGDISRVLLATDGDFNVGLSTPEAMKSLVEANRDSGTYLSVLGFGRGNYRDDMMQSLAQNGNGTAAYIDTLAEAQKTLVDNLSGALFPIANDVKIQVEFNPATIAEYRLIGYETRALAREDFNNDKVDAGDIGAGHQVTALYEVTPVGSPAILNDPLRYTIQGAPTADTELGFLKLRYKSPGARESQLITTPITRIMTAIEAPSDTGFATAIAGFAQLLKGSKYTQDWSFDDAILLAQSNKGADPFGYRAEAIRLMKLAKARK